MDEYYRVVRALGPPFGDLLGTLPPARAAEVQEIRLRAGQPLEHRLELTDLLPRRGHRHGGQGEHRVGAGDEPVDLDVGHDVDPLAAARCHHVATLAR